MILRIELPIKVFSANVMKGGWRTYITIKQRYLEAVAQWVNQRKNKESVVIARGRVELLRKLNRPIFAILTSFRKAGILPDADRLAFGAAKLMDVLKDMGLLVDDSPRWLHVHYQAFLSDRWVTEILLDYGVAEGLTPATYQMVKVGDIVGYPFSPFWRVVEKWGGKVRLARVGWTLEVATSVGEAWWLVLTEREFDSARYFCLTPSKAVEAA